MPNTCRKRIQSRSRTHNTSTKLITETIYSKGSRHEQIVYLVDLFW